MSTPSHIQRCRQWIREQLEAMATLRTSNSRDLSFKSWRQNTVTVLQRIWPDDRERVERFRRIVFTPPHTRPDGKLSREWFGKGLGESRTYLQSLLDEIDRDGVPEPSASDRDREEQSLEDEVGFPMLALDDDAEPAQASEAPAPSRRDAGGLDVTPGYTTPDEQGARPQDARTPAPPSLVMQWKPPSPSALRRRETLLTEAPPALGESSEQDAAPRPKEDRPAIEIPRAPSLPQLERPAAATPAAPAAPATPVAAKPAEPARPAPATPVAAKPAEPAKPAPAAPVATKPAAPAKPALAAPAAPKPSEPARPTPAAPVAAKSAEPAKPAHDVHAARGKNGRGKPKKAVPRQKLKDLLGLAEFDTHDQDSHEESVPPSPSAAAANEPPPPRKAVSAPVVAPERPAPTVANERPAPRAAIATPAPAEAKAPPVREHEAAPAASVSPARVASPPPAVEPESQAAEESSEEYEEDRERATLVFMQNSPVFGVVGRPVQRHTDTTDFLDPDAVAVASLASELGRLGVPDGMKASVQARLLDVARHVEDGDLDWALLRGTITDAMQYPELARRLLPVLLPWLERAA